MQLQINGKTHEVDAEADTPLLWVIRDDLGLTGTKYGCGLAQCGACSVLIDGVVTRSCVMPASAVVGRQITTIEAIEQDAVGQRVVQAWVVHQVPQCGYCQSGQVMATTSLLKQNPRPTDAEIDTAMVNLCRCGTYNAIRDAVHDLAGRAGAAVAGELLSGHSVARTAGTGGAADEVQS
ncbi:(2Fe-2S)-binding protein [Ideonella azotifigens]|uniref:(2Fe-2S)-binding protein n=1 Tax=Ideonella azotifigens TaxID=513160 RepID=A0ABN1JYS1_9BURK|nr:MULTISPECIES: (2Fe-2S)-binding protein [Ideonella]MCD2341481.1 (2Fe-2S)-binding protein [Ideonella azotifigens]HSI47118.1 (2Fe-2S)-binding protein [Ideonella sp.]